MEKSEATHIAVGATLLGVGGVALSIILPLAASTKPHPWTETWFFAAFSVAALLGLLGAYTLCAVYTGWRLPQTANERRAERFETDLNPYILVGQELRVRSVASDEEFEDFKGAYWSWVGETRQWIAAHVSESKAHEFANPHGNAANVTGSHNSEHSDYRLHLSWQLAILRDLLASRR